MKNTRKRRIKIELQNVFFIELIFYKIISIRKRHFKTYLEGFTLILDSWAGILGF